MRLKWLIVIPLLFLELLVCGAIVLALWGGLSANGLSHWGSVTVEETQEWTFTTAGPPSLDAQTVAGDIRVTGTGGDEVQVVAHLRTWGWSQEQARRQLRVEATQDGDQITVRVIHPPFSFWFGGGEADLEIHVPYEAAVTLSSTAGDLMVGDITGTVALESVSGAVTAGNIHGPLSAESVSGAVQASGGVVSGTLSLETISGDVRAVGVTASAYRLESTSGDLMLDWCRGPVTVSTVSGDIIVRECDDARLQARSSSGDIAFSGRLDDSGPHQVETISGDVTLALPADFAGDLRLEATSGEIETAFPMTMSEFSGHLVAGTVNGGGPSVSVETTSGDITLTMIGGAQ